MEDQLPSPTLRLTVASDALPLFTTVLQSGIEIKTTPGQAIATFLNTFPGFTAEYLANTVQTIFLNGTAVDDLSLPLTGKNPVLALSAAMPGLAGAIFRRNSFHSALRSATKALHSDEEMEDTIAVTLKLFNSIARDRGLYFLQAGLCMQANLLANFLTRRANLSHHIEAIRLDEKELGLNELLAALSTLSKVKIYIIDSDV